ncbi:MAG: NIPSNAP family protein [Prolixibacteraceae bacterium]|nr:NIPSNAP family protein [Prolixibacteraceae bacterium]
MTFNKKHFQRITSLVLLLVLVLIAGNTFARDYYQIKVYTIKNKTQESLIDNYLKDAYLPAMHRAGFKTVGVFKPVESDPAAGTKIFVLIPLKNISDLEKIEEKLVADKKFQSDGIAYIDAPYNNPPFERVESILLKAFSGFPDLKIPTFETSKNEQIFELRSYQAATEKLWKKKVEMFNTGGEIAIFEKLNANPVFFGEVLAGSEMPNLMYMTSYKNSEANQELWSAFGADPDWKVLSAKEEYDNTVSKIDKWLLHPTDYSDI